MAAYGVVKCGTPETMITMLAGAVSGSSSVAAFALALRSFRLLPSPAPRARVLEMGAVALPMFPAALAALVLGLEFWG
jgi:hypothetical protein